MTATTILQPSIYVIKDADGTTLWTGEATSISQAMNVYGKRIGRKFQFNVVPKDGARCHLTGLTHQPHTHSIRRQGTARRKGYTTHIVMCKAQAIPAIK